MPLMQVRFPGAARDFSLSHLSVQTLLCVSVHPRVQSHASTSERMLKNRKSMSESSVDYGNTKTPSMHSRMGSATLSQLAFPGESNPNFPWEKSHWDNTVVKTKN